MARKNVREAFIKRIENQLKDDVNVTTHETYNRLLALGVSEERAIQAIAYFYEIYFREHLENYNEASWHDFMLEVPLTNHEGEYGFDNTDARKNSRYISKHYGRLKDNMRSLESELYAIESRLIVLHDQYQLSSREATKILQIVMNRLLDIQSKTTSDYSDFATEDLLYMADGLEYILNPYKNEKVAKIIQPYAHINEDNNYDFIFKNVFLCLDRVLESIRFWDKEFGVDGYFRYINRFMNTNYITTHDPELFFNEKTLLK
ncbi:MAG: hypothetical protein LUG12_04335 [Erysipelotrichaceae bacterium]|nr:hypothetical protein [Erysipelotrichaceae bacterium]